MAQSPATTETSSGSAAEVRLAATAPHTARSAAWAAEHAPTPAFALPSSTLSC